MISAKNQYAYFENLEKTIKAALAVYLFLFLSGVLILAVGSSRSAAAIALNSPFQTIVLCCAMVGFYLLFFRRLSKVHQIGDLHIWLDRKFFGFLSRSNEIIFRTLLFALPPGERDSAYELSPRDRESIAEAIFSRLANDKHLFPSLLRSGIFHVWIWYWVTNYGTAIFSLLTIVAFPVFLIGALGFTKGAFGVFWVLALAHLLTGLLLGYRLLRMTKEVSEDIAKSYSSEIAAILRSQLTAHLR